MFHLLCTLRMTSVTASFAGMIFVNTLTINLVEGFLGACEKHKTSKQLSYFTDKTLEKFLISEKQSIAETEDDTVKSLKLKAIETISSWVKLFPGGEEAFLFESGGNAFAVEIHSSFEGDLVKGLSKYVESTIGKGKYNLFLLSEAGKKEKIFTATCLPGAGVS